MWVNLGELAHTELASFTSALPDRVSYRILSWEGGCGFQWRRWLQCKSVEGSYKDSSERTVLFMTSLFKVWAFIFHHLVLVLVLVSWEPTLSWRVFILALLFCKSLCPTWCDIYKIEREDVEFISSTLLFSCVYFQVAVLSQAKFRSGRPPYSFSKVLEM